MERFAIQVRTPLAPHSMHASVVAKVDHWMEHCSTTHRDCRGLDSRPRSAYPTRLLDLRNVKGSGTLEIFQVPEGFADEYVALSYCWGSKVAWWINYVKERQRSQDWTIELVRMPQTLQDAVTSCLSLAYSYLWIDCLCILQGNKVDWLREGGKMCDIYANSSLTISASDSKSCTDGFLTPRSQQQREGTVLPVTDDDGQVGYLHITVPGTDFPGIVGNGPVAQRAWCLQERQVTLRVLHVCQSEVFFECVRCRRFESESLPGDEFDIHSERHKFHITGDVHDLSAGKPSPYVQNVLSWCEIVQDYSRRGLAMPGDKLVAISGLARRAQQVLEGEYLAGLWRRQIHIGLAWMIDRVVSASRAQVYRAPSWSWASMEGPVSWGLVDGWIQSEDGFLESAVTVLDSKVVLEGPDPFGPVQHAEIVVSGQVKTIPAAELLPNQVLTYPAWMSGASSHLGWYLEDEKQRLDGEITCLKIGVRPFGPGPSIPPTNEMLILERASGAGNNEMETYRRIGFGQVMVTEYFDDCPPSMVRLL